MQRKRLYAWIMALAIIMTSSFSVQWNEGILASAAESGYDGMGGNITPVSGSAVVVTGSAVEVKFDMANGFKWGTSEDGSILKITGDGAMPDYNTDSNPVPWNNMKWPIETVVIEGNVTKIGNFAFEQCYNLQTIIIPETVKSIGVNAFEKCESLTGFDFSNVESIGSNAFKESGLTSVQLSGSLTDLDDEVFAKCRNLVSFSVAAGSPYYADANGVLFHKDAENVITLIAYPCAKAAVERYEIPEGTAKLAKAAFSCENIGTIVFPESMTEIGDGSCYENGFTEVVFHGPVTYIGQSSFSNSKNLESITIPATVEKIDYRAFTSSTELRNVVIADECSAVIEQYAFENTSAMESITIPPTVTQINGTAFDGTNSALTVKGYANSYAETFAKLNEYAFESTGIMEAQLLFEGYCGPDDAYEAVTWKYYNNGKLVISGEGPMMDNPWFDIGENKITAVEVEEGITRIGKEAFWYKDSIKEIILPSTLTEIGDYAFWGTQWANPSVPVNVTEIGIGAYHIEDKYINSLTVDEGNTAFAAYEHGLYNKDKTRLLKWGNKGAENNDAFTVVLADTLQVIEDYAFRNTGATAVAIPDGVITIGKEAFYNAWYLKEIHIPKNVTTIGEDALDIDGLVRITVEKGNEYFWADERGALFSKDKNVMYYYPRANEALFYQIPEGVKTVKANVKNFTWLEGLLIPNSVKEIESDTITLGNLNQDSNRHILLYGHKNSYAAEYAEKNQYTVSWGPWGDGSRDFDYEFLVIPVKEFKRLKIACPVDVYVYDAEGNEVACVKDERVVTYAETIYADDMEKTVYLPNGDDYTIEIKATGEGTVSYTIEEVTEGGNGEDITNVVEFKDIPIVADDTLKSDISMLSTEDVPVVSKNESGKIEADTVEIAGGSGEATPSPSPSPTVVPTAIPTPTAIPSPTESPTATPSPSPIPSPTESPTEAPYEPWIPYEPSTPTTSPIPSPTVIPTKVPSPTTTPQETLTPTSTPTPTMVPQETLTPTKVPVVAEDGTMTVSGEEDWTQIVDALASKIAEYEKLLEETEDSNKEDSDSADKEDKEDEKKPEIPVIMIDISEDGTLPASVLDAIAEKDIVVNLDMGNGFVWSISGTSVKNDDASDKPEEEAQSLDLGIKSGTDNIPQKKAEELVKDKKSTQFSITHDGAFGFEAKLVMDVEKLINGETDKVDETEKAESGKKENKKENKKELYANLYYYNVKKAVFEYICTGKIDADYKVAFVMNHASDYVVVVDDAPAAEAYDSYTIVQGDSLWKIAQEKLGDGRRYPEIMKLNGLKSDMIHTGNKLLIPGTAKVVINELSLDKAEDAEGAKPQDKPEISDVSEEITVKPETRKYTVKKGDCLWSIAQEYLGDGRRYNEIMKLSGLKSDMLMIGQELTIPEK